MPRWAAFLALWAPTVLPAALEYGLPPNSRGLGRRDALAQTAALGGLAIALPYAQGLNSAPSLAGANATLAEDAPRAVVATLRARDCSPQIEAQTLAWSVSACTVVGTGAACGAQRRAMFALAPRAGVAIAGDASCAGFAYEADMIYLGNRTIAAADYEVGQRGARPSRGE